MSHAPAHNRFLIEPRGNFFLFGPRGTGKSTWLRTRFPNALFLDLLDPAVLAGFLAEPGRLRARVAASKAPTVVIDEVQRAPVLLDVVHQLIESDHDRRRFILTGSSTRKLRRSGVNLFAGRLALAHMHPFLATEMGETFRLKRALTLGMLPVVLGSVDPAATLAGYAGLYLKEEVQAEGLVRNLGGFARFLEAMSLSHGGLLNLSNISRECQVNRGTVEGFLSILQDLLLAFLVEPFTRRAKRHLTEHPKFYYFDAGVFRSLRPAGPLDTPEEAGGAALEGLVAQHLRAWCECTPGHELRHWRTKNGLEVDFVVYGPRAFIALEVKLSRRVATRDLRGLKEFQADYPQAKVGLLYTGDAPLVINGIPCLPVEDFLKNLQPGNHLHLGST